MASRKSCAFVAAIGLASCVYGNAGQKPLSEPARSRKPQNPLTTELGEYIHGLLDAYHVPGIAVGVVDGEEIYTEVRVVFADGVLRGSGMEASVLF